MTQSESQSAHAFNLAIIGAGNMGGAIARGVAAARPDIKVTVSNPSEPKLKALKQECPDIHVTTSNIEAAAGADILILAVKPRLLRKVAAALQPVLDSKTAVVSLLGGVSLEVLSEVFPGAPLLRAIPNTAMRLGKSMTFIAHSDNVAEGTVKAVEGIFALMGQVAVVEERLMDPATALSSCGIAYCYKFAQAMTQAGVQMGMTPADALRYVAATMAGAAAMLDTPGTCAQQEIDKVTTPGGMTIRGINTLERKGFSAAVIDAVLASL